MAKLEYRSIWLSDIHLGARDSKTEYLYDFLRSTESQYLYLVGDVIDMWKLRSRWHWPRINNDILRLVMKKASKGTRVVYVPGNHDELLRDFTELTFGGIEVAGERVHETADGRRFLVLHGDEFDCVVMNSKWLAHIGSWAYDALLRLNHWFNVARRRLGFPYWSLSQFLKHKVKEAVSYIGKFEEAVVRAARERAADGVICGHIHHAVIREYDGMLYANTGDWVESCTALTEDADGALRLVRWVDESAALLDGLEQDAHRDRDGRVVPTS
jgi:UDP-2,3-diacylglucosamine pyrophosphatase LpxH